MFSFFVNVFPVFFTICFLFQSSEGKLQGQNLSSYTLPLGFWRSLCFLQKASLGILKCSFACLFPHLKLSAGILKCSCAQFFLTHLSSHPRHLNLNQSNVSAALPCVTVLSRSDVSITFNRRPHLPNGSPCCPKLTTSKSKTPYLPCFITSLTSVLLPKQS